MGSIRTKLTVIAASLAIVNGAGAADPEDAKPQRTAQVASKESPDEAKPKKAEKKPSIQFVPRDAGAPVTRVGGATRGFSRQALPTIDALVPERVGYTLVEQPSLYWFLSTDTDTRVDFTLIAQDATSPLVEITLDAPLTGGVHRINLADLGVTLEPGITYLWYVSLVPDPQRRSQDRVVGGALERLDSKELSARVAGATERNRAALLAQEGVWYDAVTVLSDRIAAGEGDPAARSERAELLGQVGLDRVAAADRQP